MYIHELYRKCQHLLMTEKCVYIYIYIYIYIYMYIYNVISYQLFRSMPDTTYIS